MLSTGVASCCLLLSSTLAVAHVLVRPGSGGGELQPSHWRRIVAPRFLTKNHPLIRAGRTKAATRREKHACDLAVRLSMPLFIARSQALLQKDTIAFLRTMPFSKPPRMTISATWFEQIQKSGGAGVIRIAEPGLPTKVDCLYDLHYKYVALLLLL